MSFHASNSWEEHTHTQYTMYSTRRSTANTITKKAHSYFLCFLINQNISLVTLTEKAPYHIFLLAYYVSTCRCFPPSSSTANGPRADNTNTNTIHLPISHIVRARVINKRCIFQNGAERTVCRHLCVVFQRYFFCPEERNTRQHHSRVG